MVSLPHNSLRIVLGQHAAVPYSLVLAIVRTSVAAIQSDVTLAVCEWCTG